MVDVDVDREPLVPISKDNHKKLINYPFPWQIEAYLYVSLVYIILISSIYLLEINPIIGLLLAILVLYQGIKAGKYLVARRRIGVSYSNYRQAKSIPTNLTELREQEHSKLKELEKDNISAIEDALNSLSYHNISIEKETDGEFVIVTEPAEDNPKETDSLLSGEHQIYPEDASN